MSKPIEYFEEIIKSLVSLCYHVLLGSCFYMHDR